MGVVEDAKASIAEQNEKFRRKSMERGQELQGLQGVSQREAALDILTKTGKLATLKGGKKRRTRKQKRSKKSRKTRGRK
jgi:hypothetical protein